VADSHYYDRLQHLGQLLQAPADSLPRRHLLRHRDWWDSGDHANMLDELTMALEALEQNPGERNLWWPADTEEMQPRQLLNRLREMTDLRQVAAHPHATLIVTNNTCTLNLRRARTFILTTLTFCPTCKARRRLATTCSKCSALHTVPTHATYALVFSSPLSYPSFLSAEIVRVATALNNCASSYIGKVSANKIVLIALMRATGRGRRHEKPIAMAEYLIDEARVDALARSSTRWGQMVESCNASACELTRDHFHSMDSALETYASGPRLDEKII
jgi:hypothetical protein